MASMKICALCGGRYRRSRNRPFGTIFCSRRCQWESRKVPIDLIYERDDAICHLCDKFVPRAEASRDHVRPRSQGGRLDLANIKLAHSSCNSRRGSQPVADFRAKLEAKLNLAFA